MTVALFGVIQDRITDAIRQPGPLGSHGRFRPPPARAGACASAPEPGPTFRSRLGLAFSCLSAATVGLAGCGYTLGPTTPPSVTTIAVPIFNNETFPLRREVAEDLTDAFRKEIQIRTNLRLVDHADADLVVYGTVRQFRERTVAEGRRDEKIESNLYAEITLEVEDHINRRRWTEIVKRVEPFSIERGETFEVGRDRAIANIAERLVFAIQYWEPPEERSTEKNTPPADGTE